MVLRSRWLRCRPKEVIDAVLFAPTHQRFAAEPGVGAQHDLHFRPALA
jgi:hypothetical protein